MSERKARSANFSNEEKLALLNIIFKYKHIIENKRTDHISVQQKNRTWEKVETEFNAISPERCYRNAVVLKKFYENKKKDVRRIAANEKSQIECTGSGQLLKIRKDPSYDLILSLINDKTVYGLTNSFDSDPKINVKTEVDLNDYVELTGDLINKEGTGESGEELTEFSKDLDLVCFCKSKENTKQKCTQTTLDNQSATSYNENVKQRAKRKRPSTIIRVLSSSRTARKYEELIDKRLQIADLMQAEFKQKTAEHLKRLELLELEIAIKKRELGN